MTTQSTTSEDPLVTRAREVRMMIENPACDSQAHQVLSRGYLRLLRRLQGRGINFYDARTEP